MSLLKKLLRPIKNLLKRIHHAVPLKLRNLYMPVFSRGLYFFENHLNALFLPVTIYEGLEVNSQQPLVFAYAGNIHQMHQFWDHILLAEGFQKRFVGRHLFWKIVKDIKGEFPNCGFLLAEQSSLTVPYFENKPGFPIPYWINTQIDIERPIKELLRNQRSDIERRIRKHGLSYEMTKDPKQLAEFYHRMYVPYIKDRYTDAASVNPFELLTKLKPHSELLLIKKDNQTIAAGVVVLKDGQALLFKLGVLDSNMEYMRYGSIGAIYYFLIEELKTRGYKVMEIGGSRPLLNDGLMKFKMSLGARLCKENSRHSCIKFMVLGDSRPVKTFLINNPFLFHNKNKEICRALFVENDGALTEKTLKSSYCEGIAETKIYVLEGKVPAGGNFDSGAVDILEGEKLIAR